MATHTTYKRTAESKRETRNRREMRALKYRATDLTILTHPMGA